MLVAPVTAAEAAVAAWKRGEGGGGRRWSVPGSKLELEQVWSAGPHFSSEEVQALVAVFRARGIGGVWDGLRLGVYRVIRL